MPGQFRIREDWPIPDSKPDHDDGTFSADKVPSQGIKTFFSVQYCLFIGVWVHWTVVWKDSLWDEGDPLAAGRLDDHQSLFTAVQRPNLFWCT